MVIHRKTAMALALILGGCSAVLDIGAIPDPLAPAADAASDAVAPTCSEPGCDAASDAGVVTSPQIVELAPASVYRGTASLNVHVMGAGFALGAQVASGDQVLATIFEGPTSLSFVLPGALLAKPGPFALVVRNPDGRVSTPASFVVSGCDPAGVDVPLGAATSMVTRATNLASSTLTAHSAPRGDGPLGFAPRSCPLGFLSAIVTLYRGFVVQNTTDAPLALSTWTVCTNASDTAYLGIYRRATVPGSDTDLQACDGHSAAGGGGVSGFGAPLTDNLRGSLYCPGLTVKNGGAVTLKACEKAVVVVQAFDDLGRWPVPPEVRFRVDTP